MNGRTIKGRDPLLVAYAALEPILTPDERQRILQRVRTDQHRMIDESRAFWFAVAAENRGKHPQEPKPVEWTPHLQAFKRWRSGNHRAA